MDKCNDFVIIHIKINTFITNKKNKNFYCGFRNLWEKKCKE